jgi:8-oxo-dGTP pyrophosphatase MutT (NUDIX family)
MAAEPKREIRAAGGIVWRRTSEDSDIEVAVIHRPRYDDWTIPKGKLAKGESFLEAALREVLEETGFKVLPEAELGEVRYTKTNSDGLPRPKVVHYWVMKAVSGQFAPTEEVDELRWLTIDEAAKVLTRDSDHEVLARFEEVMPSSPSPER